MPGTSTPVDMMPLRIARSFHAAEEIRAFELVQADGSALPAFTPGSHVRVRAPNGAMRKYSLCNDPHERQRYVITVKREAAGRGGSVSLVDDAREGDCLLISKPENAFPLIDAAPGYLFIAGGIGITPLLSMIRWLGSEPGIPWSLHYCTRSPGRSAYYEELSSGPLKDRTHIHHSGGDPAKSLDLWPLLERPTRAHVYCCGPRRMMEAVRDMTGHWPRASIHFESFAEGEARPEDQPFAVRLARTGRVFEVPAGKSILETLREAGVPVAFSCESGTCGTCRTGLLAGEADHRDMVLMPEEMATQIMVCVSRAHSPELVLDL